MGQHPSRANTALAPRLHPPARGSQSGCTVQAPPKNGRSARAAYRSQQSGNRDAFSTRSGKDALLPNGEPPHKKNPKIIAQTAAKKSELLEYANFSMLKRHFGKLHPLEPFTK